MRCGDFDRRLNRVLDGRRRPDDDVLLVQHALACDRCRERWDGQQALRRLVSRRLPPQLSPAFATRVLREVQRQDRRQRVERVTIAGIVGLAAGLLLVLHDGRPTRPMSGQMLGVKAPAIARSQALSSAHGPAVTLTLPGRAARRVGDGKAIASGRLPDSPGHVPDASRLFPPAVDQLRHWIRQSPATRLPREVWGVAVEQGRLTQRQWLSGEQWRPWWESLPQRGSQSLGHLAEGLRPLQASFSVTFAALWRTLVLNRPATTDVPTPDAQSVRTRERVAT